MMRTQLFAVVVIALLIGACTNKSSSPNPTLPTPVPTGTPVSLAVEGKSQMESGSSAQFRAVLTYSDNTTGDVTARAVWSSSDQTLAIVNRYGAGTVTAVKFGELSITASYENLTT